MTHEPDVATGDELVRSKDPDGKYRERRMKTYGAHCACGWRGPTRTAKHEAEEDGVEHRISADDYKD